MTTSLTKKKKNTDISFFQNKALLNRLSHQLQNIFQFTENNPKAGFSLGLSAQYLIEQRQHGFLGGKNYLSWLKSFLNMDFSRPLTTGPISSIAEVKDTLRHQFRLRYLSQTLLNLHPDEIILYGTPLSSPQSNEILESFSKAKIQFYENHLRINGLILQTPSEEESSPLKFSVKKKHVDFMESLRDPAENQYVLLFTTTGAMVVTYQKTENGAFWSFFNPDEGTYLYNNYEKFKNDMEAHLFNAPDSGQRFYDSQIKESASIKYARFSEANTLLYDKTWTHFTQKEEVYVIDQFIEKKIKLPFNKNTTVRLLGRTLNAEGHVASIRIQLIHYSSSSEVRLKEVEAPFSTLEELHLALLDPLNPFCGDFKSVAPDVVDVSKDENAKARFWIFFDSKMHPHFEIQSDEQEHILPSRIREMYDEMLISKNATDLPRLYSMEKIDTYYYSSGDFTLTKLPYKRIELYEDTPPIYASAPRILEDKIHPDNLNKKLQKYSHLNVQIVDSDFHYFKPSTLLGVDDVCDANNRHQNSSSVKSISLMNVEPDTDARAFFDFGDGNDTAVGYENKKNIFRVGNGVKKYKGGKYSDKFYLLSTMVSSVPSDLDGSEGENLIIAEHPLKGTDYSGYFINLETGKVHYCSVDGVLTLVSKIKNIKHVQGHHGTDDHLTGNHENNQLDGRGGKDTLWGKDGDDTLILAQGEAHGGRGKDHYIILENWENHPVDISIHDTKEEESNITFFSFRNISFSLIKDQATDDQYDIEIVLYSYRNSHVFIKDAYHAKNQNTLERNGHYSFYTTEGLVLSADWPETITIDENGQFAFTPQLYATYDPFKDKRHKAYFDNTPKDEISISFEKREGNEDLITVGTYFRVSIPANIQLKLIDTCFNDRLTGNSQDNMITSSRGNDYLEGKAGRDIYYIEQPENLGRTVLINNQDITADPQNDLLVLPMPLSQISDIQVIGNDIILSSGHEPYKNLQIRIQNFLLNESYRHLDIVSKKDVDEKGLDLAHTQNTLYTAKLVINKKFTGNDQNNVITSSRGNDSLAGKKGRDIYYIEPFEDPRTISIDNQDTSADFQDDLLFLPVPFIKISHIQVIGKDMILSSKQEPDKNLKIRIKNFSEESYRHLKILDNTGHLFELNVDREGQPYLDHVAGNLNPTEKADTLIINNGDILPKNSLEAQGGDDVIFDNSYSDYSLHGGEGDDIIIALENGNKKLYGGQGNDQIFAGAGNDTLTGGEGDDFLSGGNGFDTYYVSRFDGHTTIEDSDQRYKLSLTDIDREELLFTVVNKDIYITLKDAHFKDTFSIKMKEGAVFSEKTTKIIGTKNHDVGYFLNDYFKDAISSFNTEEQQQLVKRYEAPPVLVENTVQLVTGY